MKKKIILTSSAIIMGLTMVFAAAQYYYGFILSCGTTIYQTSDRELSSEQLLAIHDALELTLCPNPNEQEIDPS